VKSGKAAASAEAVALARAIESGRVEHNRLFFDPYARAFLGPGRELVARLCGVPLLGPMLLGLADWLVPGLYGFAVARTRFIDDALRGALDCGLEQVVVLGAGYDSRAHRIPGIEAVRVFEVDHPDTQKRKRALLGPLLQRSPDHVCFVSVDFEHQSLSLRLREAGFRSGVRTFFIWEGVTEYLDADAVDATLRYVASVSAPNSELVFTYNDLGLMDGTKRFVGGKLLLTITRWGGEPYRFGLDPAELGQYLGKRGFDLLEDPAGTELSRRYFVPLGRRDRASEYERVALARVLEQVGPPHGKE
jgi:methyltransferase (TIGR00027 family)